MIPCPCPCPCPVHSSCLARAFNSVLGGAGVRTSVPCMNTRVSRHTSICDILECDLVLCRNKSATPMCVSWGDRRISTPRTYNKRYNSLLFQSCTFVPACVICIEREITPLSQHINPSSLPCWSWREVYSTPRALLLIRDPWREKSLNTP
jgi:hypothetical protein